MVLAKEGRLHQSKQYEFYNLDLIIEIGNAAVVETNMALAVVVVVVFS
jgi:hypothetical protein